MPEATAMIYSARLGGHRQLHCDAFTDLFLELGYSVIMAVGLGDHLSLERWEHIEKYRMNQKIIIVDTKALSPDFNGNLTVEDLVRLQATYNVNVTLFPCGDEYRNEFIDIYNGNSSRLLGWNIGIFGWTQDWCPIESPFDPGLSISERLRASKRFLVKIDNPDRYFFEDILAGRKVLDKILVKDERVAEIVGDPFNWFPDIYRPFEWENNTNTDQEYQQLILPYQKFLQHQIGREILFFFGEPSVRKGYDLLLQLAWKDRDTCFVHCGRPYKGDGWIDDVSERFEFNVLELKASLQIDGRYYETGQRLENWLAIDYFWNSIEKFISTHWTYGSSGTVLQAMEKGKPVLLPNRGFFHYLINKGVGRGYQPRNFHSLFVEWKKFKKQPNSIFLNSIQNYMKYFTRSKLLESLQQVLPK